MTAQPELSFVIVSYNTRELTLACLRSVYAWSSRIACTIIVLDNGSTDGSAEAVAAEFPNLRLIRSQINLGFAAANNLAACPATGEYILLLNPDTVVVDGAIQKLLECARGWPAAGIWGGRTLFPDGSLNPASCWSRQTLWSVVCCALGLSSIFRGWRLFDPEAAGFHDTGSPREVDIVSGCFLLIRRELWDRLGGFDPEFFMYGEDADLCLRARALGARPMITPEATIIHYGGASEPVRSDKMVRLLDGKVRLIRRHWSPAAAVFGIAMLKLWPLTRAVVWAALSPLQRRGRAARQHASSWWSVFRRRAEWAGAGGGSGPMRGCAASVTVS